MLTKHFFVLHFFCWKYVPLGRLKYTQEPEICHRDKSELRKNLFYLISTNRSFWIWFHDSFSLPSHSTNSEQSIIGARASVMVYDDVQRKWIPSGSSSGLSKVQIFHHQQNNTFRVVGRKLQDHEVVINCSIIKGLKYNQATATFHQWRDSKFVYGLNFSSPMDAEAFARAMMHALDVSCCV